MVMVFCIRVAVQAVFNMPEKIFSGIKRSAAFTPLKGELPNNVLFDGNRADPVLIFYLDQVGGAEVGAGAAPDTSARFRHDPGSFFIRYHF